MPPGSPARAGGPVSTPVIAAALRGALGRDPGIFAPVAEHPATETALVQRLPRAARRLARRRSSAWQPRAPGRSTSSGSMQRLAGCLETGFYDEEDLIGRGAEALDGDQVRRLGLGNVVVYLPQRLSRHGAALLAASADTPRCRVAGRRDG